MNNTSRASGKGDCFFFTMPEREGIFKTELQNYLKCYNDTYFWCLGTLTMFYAFGWYSIVEINLKTLQQVYDRTNVQNTQGWRFCLSLSGCRLWVWLWRSCWWRLRNKTPWPLASMNQPNFSMRELHLLQSAPGAENNSIPHITHP